jgi:hypothetical protein
MLRSIMREAGDLGFLSETDIYTARRAEMQLKDLHILDRLAAFQPSSPLLPQQHTSSTSYKRTKYEEIKTRNGM